MKRITMFLTLAMLLFSGLAFSQANEGFGQQMKLDVAIQRHSWQTPTGAAPEFNEGHAFHNQYTIIARHCQKYKSPDQHVWHKAGHLWWGKLVYEGVIPGVIDEEACNADPTTVFYNWTGHNLITNAGYDQAASALANTATQAAACNYGAWAIDSSNSGAGTIAITDTALNSSGTGSTELTGDIARAQYTYAHSAGTLTFTLSKTTSITTTHTGVNKFGVFNAASTGTLCWELLATPFTVNNGDTLQPTLTDTMSNP